MLSDLSIVQFIVVQASFAFSPGLIIALIVNESIQNSRRKGFEVAGGAALGGLILAFISASIVTFLYSAIPIFLQIIYLFGSVFILYKGLSILTRKDIETKKSEKGAFYSGLKVNLINPKMWVLYLSVIPIFITNYDENLFTSLVFLGILTVLINFGGDMAYALLSSYFFSDSSDRTKKIINRLSGVSLICIGLYLLFSRFF